MNYPPGIIPQQTLTNLNVKNFQAVVNEIQSNNQVPYALSLFASLGALSTVIQGVADVRTPIGTVVPLSLYIMIIAMSGERKTKVEGDYQIGIREFEERMNATYREDLAVYEADHEIWALRKSALKKAYQKKVAKGADAEMEADSMKMHLHIEPVCPKGFRVLYDDATIPALLQGLNGSTPIACFSCSEGSTVLDGPLFNAQQAIANNLWSGTSITVDRVYKESFTLKDARLSISAMVQPGVIERYWREKGEKARATGLMSRLLVCVTGTTQGTRFLKDEELKWVHRERFRQRIIKILEKYAEAIKAPDFKRQIIEFSPEAKIIWREFFDNSERHISPYGHYGLAGDHASKLAENAARVAALLHYFEGYAGDISAETLRAALIIVTESSQHFMNTFIYPSAMSDSQILDAYLTELRSEGKIHVLKNEVMRNGPGKLRKAVDFKRALAPLVEAGSVREYKTNKTHWLDISYLAGLKWR